MSASSILSPIHAMTLTFMAFPSARQRDHLGQFAAFRPCQAMAVYPSGNPIARSHSTGVSILDTPPTHTPDGLRRVIVYAAESGSS